jgi:L-arabinose transport system ATP-binding protein
VVGFHSISKAFAGVQALHNVSFAVADGSIHALCGENGAGKSTLLKVLSGVHRPETGHVEIDGTAYRFRTTWEALDAGVAVIYQELNLVPEMSVAENVWLGHFARKGPFVDRRELARRTTESLRRVGLDVSPWTRVGSLSLAQRQMVETAKALSRNARVIAFDEPTSSLSAREVDTLFALIRELRDRGLSVLYVSHRMDEVVQLCDACTVLRDGQHIETFESMEGVDAGLITNRMVGRELIHVKSEIPSKYGPPVLEVHGVRGPGLAEPVSLVAREGEIVGIFGLVGAGRTELLKAIYMGTEGQVLVRGVPAPRRGPDSSIRAGIVFCPEDRKKEGIVPMLSVSENINLSIRRALARLRVWLAAQRERENAQRFIERLRIRTSSLQTPVANLSGGNQQKVILARWLSEDVKAILFDEPTRGIDVGAKAEIFAIVRGLAAQGIGVVFVSSELPEILALSHRVIVMCEGRVTGEMPTSEATEQALLELALPKSASTGVSA